MMGRTVGLLLVTALAGCASAPTTARAPIMVGDGRGVVFVADGAGGSTGVSQAFRQAVAAEGLPWQVQTVAWSHGPGWFLADQTDYANVRDAGAELAAAVRAVHAAQPQAPIYLVGHSAGTAVALAAAEQLPPNSVEDIVLLAPAVASNYDVRPALLASRRGIDAFTSPHDTFYLRFGTGLVGTTDRQWYPAAGRVGFQPVLEQPGDAELYRRLRNHAWDRSVSWTGNNGGHFGSYTVPNLRAYVLPQMR